MHTGQPGIHKTEPIPIREIFPKEAADFTPWLANPRHLDQLGAALHLELEFEGQEVDCGGFTLDILAREKKSGCLVAIENQLEGSDTRHLGQLLTYAAIKEVGMLVWIATSFWGKHRAAIEWLNTRTSESIELYGVEVRGTRVGESDYSVNFVPILFPEEWLNRNGIAGHMVKESSRKYRSFFQPLVTDLWWDNFTENGHALYRSEQVFPSGFSDISYVAGFSGNEEVWVYLWIATSNKECNKNIYGKLHVARGEIEERLDAKLHWIGQPKGRTQASFGTSRKGSIVQSDDVLQEIRKWMAELLPKFKNAVQSYLSAAIQDS